MLFTSCQSSHWKFSHLANLIGNVEVFTSIHEIKWILNSSNRFDSTRLTHSSDSDFISSVDVRHRNAWLSTRRIQCVDSCLIFSDLKIIRLRTSTHRTPAYLVWEGLNDGRRAVVVCTPNLTLRRWGPTVSPAAGAYALKYDTHGVVVYVQGTGAITEKRESLRHDKPTAATRVRTWYYTKYKL